MRLKHEVNIKNMISQMGNEHDLLTELVTNGLESADSSVDITYDGKTLTITNDGSTLSVQDIREKLLTAFETGDEKDLSTNRGLGFIAIYNAMTMAYVCSGDIVVVIHSWDDIQVESIHDDNPFDEYVDGFSIMVRLNESYRQKYVEQDISERLEEWIIFDDVEITYNEQSAGKNLRSDIMLEKVDVSDHNVTGVSIGYNLSLFEETTTFLLKLTNVEAYRLLPIDFDLGDVVQGELIDDIVVLFTNSSGLDTSRTSIEFWTRRRIRKHIKKKEEKLSIDYLKNGKESFGRKAFKLIAKGIRQFREIDMDVAPVLDNFRQKLMNDDRDISDINKQLVNYNRLVTLINMTSLGEIFDFRLITSSEVYGESYSNFNLNKVVSSYKFLTWFSIMFEMETSNLFMDENIGLLVNDGEVVGNAKLYHAIEDNEYEYTTVIDGTLWSEDLLRGQTIILIFKEDYYFFSKDMPERLYPFELREERNRSSIDIEETEDIEKFVLSKSSEIGQRIQSMVEDSVHAGEENTRSPLSTISYQDSHDTTEEEGGNSQVREGIRDVLERYTSTEVDKLEEKIALRKMEFTSFEGVPFLVDNKRKKDFEKFKSKSRHMKRAKHTFRIWKGLIAVSLELMDQKNLMPYIVPTLFISEKTHVAHSIGRLIGLSIDSLPNISDNKINKVLFLLESAIHEIAHLFVNGHNDKYMRTYNTLIDRVTRHPDLYSKINEIF